MRSRRRPCSTTSRSSTTGSVCIRPWTIAPRPRRRPAWKGSPCSQPHDALFSPFHLQGEVHGRGALDMIEFAGELEVRALLLLKTEDGSKAAPVWVSIEKLTHPSRCNSGTWRADRRANPPPIHTRRGPAWGNTGARACRGRPKAPGRSLRGRPGVSPVNQRRTGTRPRPDDGQKQKIELLQRAWQSRREAVRLPPHQRR